VFERFTDRGRQVVVLAQEEARLLQHDRIGTEHLLLALLHVEHDETAQALQRVGVTLPVARQWVEQSQGRGKHEPRGHIPFTPRAKKVLELALRVTQRLGGQAISEPHLLRAMLDVPDSTAYRLLDGLGVDTEDLARLADQLALASQADTGRVAAGPTPGAWASRERRLQPPGGYLSAAESHDRLVARIEELAVQSEERAQAIRRFARHDESCQPERGCSCGLQSVLDSLAPFPAQGRERREWGR
jgi:ATP-dependent Clp protease ATP-binding subunit ClpC